jgi:tyrosyl-tRNA synthetase
MNISFSSLFFFSFSPSNIDKVADLIEDMNEQITNQEDMQEQLAQPIGSAVYDDDDLLKELEMMNELQSAEQQKEAAPVSIPTVSTPAVSAPLVSSSSSSLSNLNFPEVPVSSPVNNATVEDKKTLSNREKKELDALLF